MKQNNQRLILLFFYFLFTNYSFAQTEQFGQLNYSPPAGWKLAKYQNGIQMILTGPGQNDLVTIQIMQAFNFSGSIEQAFEKAYDETCSMLQVSKMSEVNGKYYSAKEPKISFMGWEYMRGSGGIQVNNGSPYPSEYGLELFLIKINDRFERIAIVNSRNTCNGLTRYYPAERLSVRNAIENFLFSIRFSDRQDPIIKTGIIKAIGITGAWQGLSMSVGLAKPGAELGTELKEKQLILFSNGQAYFGKNFPAEGLDELNTWIAAENNRRDWGTYSIVNGSGVLKLPYADIPLRMESDKLIVTSNKTEHRFIKLPFIDGISFNGNYIMREAYGTIPAISFTADGKFIDKGAVRILYHEYTDCVNEAMKPGTGTYEVKNHSLILKYSDGRKIKIAIPGSGFENNNSSPSTLILSSNQDTLKKQ